MIDLSFLDSVGNEVWALFTGSNLIAIAIVVIREIGISKLRNTLNTKEIEINELNGTIKDQSGTIEQMKSSQIAIVNSISIIGKMVNRAYMSSKLDAEAKTDIAVMYGELDTILKEVAVVGLELLEDKLEEGIDSVLGDLPEGAAKGMAESMVDAASDIIEDVVQQVPEYLKNSVGNE